MRRVGRGDAAGAGTLIGGDYKPETVAAQRETSGGVKAESPSRGSRRRLYDSAGIRVGSGGWI